MAALRTRSNIIVPLFTNSERNQLMHVISNDPLVLSLLINRELPDDGRMVCFYSAVAGVEEKYDCYMVDSSCYKRGCESVIFMNHVQSYNEFNASVSQSLAGLILN
ncbi:MAG: hypothetical protein JEZ14_00075 [Marinilabiliaceae bacterium]|nr:hypothetical protein [Marinilabiliaceae bacterium]